MTRASWTNSDGLVQYFGPRKSENSVPAEAVNPSLGRKMITVYFRGEDLGDTVTPSERGALIPSGSYLRSATLTVQEAFAGATAVLDLGIYKVGATGTDDDDGIDAAVAVASLTAGVDIACDGAAIGTVLTGDYRIGPSYDTAAFTAGSAKLVVEFDDVPVQTS